jgi:hypothetical protein
MAYTRQSDAVALHDPLVLHHYVKNSNQSDVSIRVPWDDVKLVYIYSIVETAIDGNGDCVLTFEFNAAAGTEIATMTVATSAAVGDIDEATFSDRLNQPVFWNGSAVNIDINGDSSPAGALNIYFYFEPVL